MYFDPDWIFSEKPDKHQYPNITGLMGEFPPPEVKKKPKVTDPARSLADVFRMSPIKPQLNTVAQVFQQRPLSVTPQDVAANKVKYTNLERQESAQVMAEQRAAEEKARQDEINATTIWHTDRRTTHPILKTPLDQTKYGKSARYNTATIESFFKTAKQNGVSGKDAFYLLGIPIQESGLGNLSRRLTGDNEHYYDGMAPEQQFDTLIKRMVGAKNTFRQEWKDQKGIDVPENDATPFWLQTYNGKGALKGKYYGIENPDMGETQAYGRWIQSIGEDFYNDPDMQKIYQKVYGNQ